MSSIIPFPVFQKSNMKFPNFFEFRFSCFRQYFSIPESIIFYVSKNPTSMKLYQKLIQTCKYFFIKNPIIILHCLRFEEHEWRICDKNNCKEYHTYRKINFAKIQSKISVSKNLQITSSLNPSIASSLIRKLYNGNVETLEFHGQNISFNDLLFFSKTIRQIDLQKSTVFYQNGVIVPYEIIVANLPKLLCFECDSNADYDFSNTVTELLKIPNFKNLKFFFLFGLNESFDMETLFKQCLKKNIQTVFCFQYFDNVPLSFSFNILIMFHWGYYEIIF